MAPCIGLALCLARLQPGAGSSPESAREVVIVSCFSEGVTQAGNLKGTCSWLHVVEIVQQNEG